SCPVSVSFNPTTTSAIYTLSLHDALPIFPGESEVAAVRLDTTGLQLLYKYETGTGNSKVFLPDQKVGYYFFYDETTLITAALSGTGMDLMKNDLKTGTSEILIKKIGRSIHKIPQSHLISYTILNEQNELDLYLLDLEKEEPESFRSEEHTSELQS